MARGTWQGGGTWQTSGGSGGLALAVIIAAIAIGSGAASAAASALVTIVIAVACVLGAAVLGAAAWLVHVARRDRPGQLAAGHQAHELPGVPRPGLEAPGRLALEPGRELHLHIHVADPADAAAIIRQAIPGPSGDALTEGK